VATLDVLGQVIAENFLLIFGLIMIAIIVGVLSRTLVAWKRMSNDTRFAQMDLERKKLDAITEKQKREELREAAVLLTDRERDRIETIRVDRGVLSRRSIALMNEVEERVGRLERGTENAKLYQLLGDVSSQEHKLFRVKEVKNNREVKRK
jgi:hypothetical protein